ncbi:MAG: hypothetical protein M1284_02190 [Candidatus Parvarchaeota archaeon]|nr:hypothetical protein [Candidatus Parvarchaeota archaeon]
MTRKLIAAMVTRNLIAPGYPFLEAIYSILRTADMLYILDDSSDGTEKILQELSKNKKIKIIKERWKTQLKNGRAIGVAQTNLVNEIKKRHLHDYILLMQSNEIIHENAYTKVKEFLSLYENEPYSSYALPFQSYSGRILQGIDWRIRIGLLSNKISSLGDGTQISILNDAGSIYAAKFLFKSFLYFVKYDSFYDRLFNLSKRKIMPMILPESIFRYYLFPDNLISRYAAHVALYKGNERYEIVLNKLKEISSTDNLDEFFLLYLKILSDTEHNPKNSEYHRNEAQHVKTNIDTHPKIIRDLINKKAYVVRRSLINSILKL